MRVALFKPDQAEEWTQTVHRSAAFDFYHLCTYHGIAQARGEGRAILLVIEEGEHFIALPYLLRPLSEVKGLEGVGGSWLDATSVYGYVGPIASSISLPDSFLSRARGAMAGTMLDLGVVSCFSRLHPLIPQRHLLAGLGELVPAGLTVSLDLSTPPETQWSQYRRDHRYGIGKARRTGLRAYHDEEWNFFDDFFRLYEETMQRVDASSYYFFERDYFLRLRDALGDKLNLFVAEFEGNICSASLLVQTGGIIQYHLSGSDPRYAKLAPSKVILDEARMWANSIGASRLHLGGGVGGREDSLFQFKAGFSPSRHTFHLWKWVLMPEVYAQMVAARQGWKGQSAEPDGGPDFFPSYRA
jgi:hypothetical protein